MNRMDTTRGHFRHSKKILSCKEKQGRSWGSDESMHGKYTRKTNDPIHIKLSVARPYQTKTFK